MAVAFDESLTTSFRNQIYPRVQGESRPRARRSQAAVRAMPRVLPPSGHSRVQPFRIRSRRFVGTLMTRCRNEGLRATLVTRDKDYAQLIRAGDVYWDYSDNVRYRYDEIEDRFGVAPERFADFLALMGDSVDNIKGVPASARKPPRR
jgi:5'-3' exonuclease